MNCNEGENYFNLDKWDGPLLQLWILLQSSWIGICRKRPLKTILMDCASFIFYLFFIFLFLCLPPGIAPLWLDQFIAIKNHEFTTNPPKAHSHSQSLEIYSSKTMHPMTIRTAIQYRLFTIASAIVLVLVLKMVLIFFVFFVFLCMGKT